ncbi:DUF5343 domain-containing protein [Amycolatopsis sp. NPDC024027]|uniref:DUF5343 domain-containing protein n=1 Tax=Amycolatopsis sp. NPDC024027 TaxID=3154327 RepID=UPI0034004D42
MPNYPYISGQGPVVATFTQLRKGFPPKVDAGYLQRFKIASANESYVIAILRFLDLIDEEGNRVEDKTGYFYGNDDSFKAGLEEALRSAYSQLFEEMGNDTFDAERDVLAHWFRAADKTSELVGKRQATTFQSLAALAGHGELRGIRTNPNSKSTNSPNGANTKTSNKKTATTTKKEPKPPIDQNNGRGEPEGKAVGGQDVGLTVRIEVNLPPGGDAETYDAIFASIRKHLMS